MALNLKKSKESKAESDLTVTGASAAENGKS